MKNKKTLALSVLAVAAIVLSVILVSTARAHGDAPSVSVYGRLDAGAQSFDTGSETVIRAGESGLLPSFLGFKGNSANLGGIQFNFQLEGGLKPNTATLGSTTTTGSVFTREAWVGISGSAGEVRFGTTDLTDAAEIDTLGRQFGKFGNFAVNGSAIEIGEDVNNVMKYISPTIGGFQAQLGYSGNSASATTDTTAGIKGGSLTYASGPAKFGVGYAAKDGASDAAKTDAKSIGGAYNFGVATVGAAYIYGDNSTTSTVKSTASMYSVKVPLDKDGLSAHAVYTTAKDGAQTSANEGQGYTVGLTKQLAPNAVLYGAYSWVSNDANSAMYTNNMSAPAAGKDPKLAMVGVAYSF
jgi:predicted porin